MTNSGKIRVLLSFVAAVGLASLECFAELPADQKALLDRVVKANQAHRAAMHSFDCRYRCTITFPAEGRDSIAENPQIAKKVGRYSFSGDRVSVKEELNGVDQNFVKNKEGMRRRDGPRSVLVGKDPEKLPPPTQDPWSQAGGDFVHLLAENKFDVLSICETILDGKKCVKIDTKRTLPTPDGKQVAQLTTVWFSIEDGYLAIRTEGEIPGFVTFEATTTEILRIEHEGKTIFIPVKYHDLATNMDGSLRSKKTYEIDKKSIRIDPELANSLFEISIGPNDRVIDLDRGQELANPVKRPRIGDDAPLFETKTVDGKPLKLADFRGKYVLLDFWATWCGPCRRETPHLKATYEALGSEPNFVMIGLSLDRDVEAPKAYAAKHDLKWVQGFLEPRSREAVLGKYGVEGIPSIFLVGPDGKVVAKGLRGERIKATVGQALKANE